jgi:hypothetical protein
MKKTINRKVYDTSKARRIISYYKNGLQGYNGTYNTHYYKNRNGYFKEYNGDIYTDNLDYGYLIIDEILNLLDGTCNIVNQDFNENEVSSTFAFIVNYNMKK